MRERIFSVYILMNERNTVLYIGVTGDIVRRIYEHKNRVNKSFTKKFHIDRLVYFEDYQTPGAAIYREKQLKGWRRIKKLNLIRAQNPDLRDLAARWY